ncbi:MAG: HAMP domain-containing histidine kinase [Pirellulales bacterium]|nr:HAMP domain-containing histidine kinase [Pirellulales bacterium]
MRWPIRLQLLLPNLAVATVAILLLSVAMAVVSSRREREQQQTRLSQTVSTLAAATFPLTDPVLEQMTGLSGAEFVVLDSQGGVRGSTLPLKPSAGSEFAALPLDREPDAIGHTTSLRLHEQDYVAHRVLLRRSASQPRVGDSLVVLYADTRWSDAAWNAAFPPLAIGMLAALAVVVVSLLLSRRLVQPIEHVRRHAASIASGDFRPMQLPLRDDETRDLAISINDMAARLARSAEEIRRRERLATLDQLGAGMAHQMRNSATGARLAIELHRRGCSEDDESLRVAADQLRLMESHVQRMLALGSRAEPQEGVSLDHIVDDIVRLLQPRAKHQHMRLEFTRPAEPVLLRGDAGALGQLVVNLVTNALDAVERLPVEARKVTVELTSIPRQPVRLDVRDTGPGPTAEIARTLFEPFVTDKADGTGLGLAVAREIARAHGGDITWSREQGTTCFRVELPAPRDVKLKSELVLVT